jgi:Flp pilus assembly protein TadB
MDRRPGDLRRFTRTGRSVEDGMKKWSRTILIASISGALVLGVVSVFGFHGLQALVWIVGLGAGAWLYVRGARKRDEDRLLRSSDRMLERPSVSLDPGRVEGRAQAQADRFSGSPRNLRR